MEKKNSKESYVSGIKDLRVGCVHALLSQSRILIIYIERNVRKWDLAGAACLQYYQACTP